ncbi:neurotrimin-like isoform X2, partial [Vespula squamosa]
KYQQRIKASIPQYDAFLNNLYNLFNFRYKFGTEIPRLRVTSQKSNLQSTLQDRISFSLHSDGMKVLTGYLSCKYQRKHKNFIAIAREAMMQSSVCIAKIKISRIAQTVFIKDSRVSRSKFSERALINNFRELESVHHRKGSRPTSMSTYLIFNHLRIIHPQFRPKSRTSVLEPSQNFLSIPPITRVEDEKSESARVIGCN